MNPGGQKSDATGVDIHTATIFESRHESSIFYQRQVDDVIVVNSTLKQSSDGTAQTTQQQHSVRKCRN